MVRTIQVAAGNVRSENGKSVPGNRNLDLRTNDKALAVKQRCPRAKCQLKRESENRALRKTQIKGVQQGRGVSEVEAI